MREFSIEENLRKKLKKLSRKDIAAYTQVMGKIEEIISCRDVNHYKNLRKPLQEFKRVHIRGSSVLVFKYDNISDKIEFYDLDHHDTIYR